MRRLLPTSLCLAALVSWQAHAAGREPLGCTVITDARTGATLVREGVCDRRFSPMSTFKLPLAIMGFDSGILESPTSPVWAVKPEFNPSKRELAFPEVDPTIWEKQSIVWFSQQLTIRLGEQKFAGYVTAFDYGNKDVSGGAGKGDGLTRSWLMSSLEISPDEQVGFLLRFVNGGLPVSGEAISLTRETIPRFASGAGWVVHGKTGSGRLRDDAGRIDQNRPLGWFVGWARKEGREVVFARLYVGVDASEAPASIRTRDSFLEELPGLMDGR